jgi:hypothetical protein
MASPDQAVRDAASALKAAISAATSVGYRVEWPSRVEDLDAVAVSETAAVAQPQETPAVEPAVASPADDHEADAILDAAPKRWI